MTTKRIVYTLPAGNVALMTPASHARLISAFTVDGQRYECNPPAPLGDAVHYFGTEDIAPEFAGTEDEFLQWVAAKDVPAGVQFHIVDDNVLPADNVFFDAWRLSDAGVVSVDLTHAREITKERLRRERAPLLVAQDVAYQRATESGGNTASVVAEKNRLRDLTKAADTASTLDQLKALKAA
jgi:hypothetical protein